MRIRVVGGQVDRETEAAVRTSLGTSIFQWLPSEENKKPPLDNWKRLNPASDIIVCITGAIGHDSSGKAKATAARLGVPFLGIESVGEMVAVLVSTYCDHCGTQA
jgi:hypothetical protein